MGMLFYLMFPFFLFLGLIFLLISFFFMSLNFSIFIHWEMLSSSYMMSFPIFLDFMSCSFMGLVMIISGSIIFYSHFYMEIDLYKDRFFYLMFFFVLSMIFLILSPNLIFMLIGWDGLGLVSYCLVIYYQNFKSFSSGMITALTNRIGDIFILASIGMFFEMGSWGYMNMILVDKMNMMILFIFLMVAAMTKSAQIPFSSWLPEAMAAPTPVSSLVHSSTLVTAGVYLLLRFSYLFHFYSEISFILLIIGVMTTIMAGLSALYEFDLKKIIALSTLSQLGFMIFTVSLNFIDMAFFHLIMHACFKALLFMCAGVLIHSFYDLQDVRSFGLINKNFFVTICMFSVSNLSLTGLPFLSGFYSKDLILEYMMNNTWLNMFLFFLVIFSVMLTVFYSFRLMIFLNFNNCLYFKSVVTDNKMLFIEKSMFVLYIFSISMGFFYSKYLILPYNFIILPIYLKILIPIMCLFSFFIIKFLSKYKLEVNFSKKFFMFFKFMWFLPFLSTDFIKKPILDFSLTYLSICSGWIEQILGFKFVFLMNYSSFQMFFLLKKNVFILFFLFFLFFVFFVFGMM